MTNIKAGIPLFFHSAAMDAVRAAIGPNARFWWNSFHHLEGHWFRCYFSRRPIGDEGIPDAECRWVDFAWKPEEKYQQDWLVSVAHANACTVVDPHGPRLGAVINQLLHEPLPADQEAMVASSRARLQSLLQSGFIQAWLGPPNGSCPDQL